MKPVFILRHIACEGPGYLADFFNSHNIPYQLICIDEGELVPASLDYISGLVFMGGPMSVNDPLPWIEAELDLIRNAQNTGIPILGHCLGAQLISKALGGIVKRSPVREIGWFKVSQYESCMAPYWLDNLPAEFDAFHMHGEMFSIPEGAALLLKSKYCDHQAFSISNTLALQFHIEITEELIRKWVDYYEDDLANPSTGVQSRNEILSYDSEWFIGLNKMAEKIYLNWLKGFN